jgi:hypothetical protein
MLSSNRPTIIDPGAILRKTATTALMPVVIAVSSLTWLFYKRGAITSNGVIVASQDDDQTMALVRASEALALISNVTPWRIAAMRRSVRGVVLTPLQTQYVPSNRILYFALTGSPKSTVSWTAACLVFAITEARVTRRISPLNLKNSPTRIRRLCLEEAIAFLRRVPDATEEIETMSRWWAEAEWAKDSFESELVIAKSRGVPNWLLRGIAWLHGRRIPSEM